MDTNVHNDYTDQRDSRNNHDYAYKKQQKARTECWQKINNEIDIIHTILEFRRMRVTHCSPLSYGTIKVICITHFEAKYSAVAF